MTEPVAEDYKCVRSCACDDHIREDSFTRRGSFTEVMFRPPSFQSYEKLRMENEKLQPRCFCCF